MGIDGPVRLLLTVFATCYTPQSPSLERIPSFNGGGGGGVYDPPPLEDISLS